MKIIVIADDGQKIQFDDTNSLRSLMEYIKRSDVETIVVGEVDANGVVWEKQFKPVTVMPSNWGEVKL